MKNNKFWIETELCIVDHNGDILPKVSSNVSSFEFISQILQTQCKQWINNTINSISPEELWHQIEIKNTQPFSDMQQAFDDIQTHIDIINNTKEIREKMQLIFTPVSPDNFEVFPAINDENAHQRKLFDTIISKFWEHEWQEIVKWFATFSTQVNISWLFDGINIKNNNAEFLELARRFLNTITSLEPLLTQHNWIKKNWQWKTRQEIAFDVLSKLKGNNFWDRKNIIIPPIFETSQQMLTWIAQHCWVNISQHTNLWDLNEKDMHGFLAKLKWMTYQGIELRAFDATENHHQIINTTQEILSHLDEVKKEFFHEHKIKHVA